MVPETYFFISSIPKRTADKVDRRALKNQDEKLSREGLRSLSVTAHSHSSLSQNEKPRTQDEKTLQALWAHVLGVDRNQVGRGDSWFEHGGDSLLAMKLAANASKMGLCVTMKTVYEHPTLCQLARLITPIEEIKIATTPFQMLCPDSKTFVKVMQCLNGQSEGRGSNIEVSRTFIDALSYRRPSYLGQCSRQAISAFEWSVNCQGPWMKSGYRMRGARCRPPTLFFAVVQYRQVREYSGRS